MVRGGVCRRRRRLADDDGRLARARGQTAGARLGPNGRRTLGADAMAYSVCTLARHKRTQMAEAPWVEPIDSPLVSPATENDALDGLAALCGRASGATAEPFGPSRVSAAAWGYQDVVPPAIVDTCPLLGHLRLALEANVSVWEPIFALMPDVLILASVRRALGATYPCLQMRAYVMTYAATGVPRAENFTPDEQYNLMLLTENAQGTTLEWVLAGKCLKPMCSLLLVVPADAVARTIQQCNKYSSRPYRLVYYGEVFREAMFVCLKFVALDKDAPFQ